MSDVEQKHYVICKLKELATELGRVPMRHELEKLLPRVNIDLLFGTYDGIMLAAGFRELPQIKEKQEKQKKFKYLKSQIESFKVNEIDLPSLFAKFKNPTILKSVAQPDTHMKHRDKAALETMLNFCEWYQPHLWIIGGDLMDCADISHWPIDSLNPRQFIPEVKETREFLDEAKRRCPNTEFIYICGNHEDWIRQAMVAKMPEFFNGLDELGLSPNLEALLELDKRGIELFPVNELVKIGKAHFTHGLFAGNNHPKKHLDTIKGNIYYFHTHDVLSTHQPSINGFIEAQSLGCLCKLDAPFLRGKPNNWAHAFGNHEFRIDGSYSFHKMLIFNGKLSYAGKTFDA